MTENTTENEATESTSSEPTNDGSHDELNEALRELKAKGSEWVSKSLSAGQKLLEESANTLRDRRSGGEAEKDDTKTQPQSNGPIDAALGDLVSIGRTWARYGLSTGQNALEATADTLRSTASFLAKLANHVDAELASVPNDSVNHTEKSTPESAPPQ